MARDSELGLVGIAHLKPQLADAQWERFYINAAGAVTYRHVATCGTWFLKVAPAGFDPTPEAEAARMRWARPYLRVPKVCGTGQTQAGSTWLLSEALPGLDATRSPLRQHPRQLVTALAEGLRHFHDAPVASCPFSFRWHESVSQAADRVRQDRVVPTRHFHPEHAHLSAAEALDCLQRAPVSAEDLVPCHGDYCLPNVLIEGNAVTGYVDLGELGVADRWWDLAVATWSVTWNLGPGLEQHFLDAYGVQLDSKKQARYRLLYDLVS